MNCNKIQKNSVAYHTEILNKKKFLNIIFIQSQNIFVWSICYALLCGGKVSG